MNHKNPAQESTFLKANAASRMKETTTMLNHLNAQAIARLQVGDYRGSSSVLQQALAQMSSALEEQGGGPDDLEGSHGVDCQGRICVPVGSGQDCLLSEEERPGPVFCLFDRAFALLPASDDTNRISSTILYNLALSHSLAWRELRGSNDLQTAIQLYKMALAVVEESSFVNDDFVNLHLLSIFNNLGYLQSQQPLTEEANRHCIDAIQALLINQEATRSAAHDEDYQFFRWSSFFLFNSGPKDLPLAPAA